MAYLTIGSKNVDLLQPTAEMIDLAAIEENLWQIRRFSGNPRALVVRQHTALVEAIARLDKATDPVIDWCRRHDDHEGVLGDMPGPYKDLLAGQTAVLAQCERRLDIAICDARLMSYPSTTTRRTVHYYDKLAATVEYRHLIADDQPWFMSYPGFLDDARAEGLAHWARSLNPVAEAT